MTFTYSANLTDATSRVRQTLGDIVDAGHLIENETIAYYLTTEASELAVALRLAQDLMARFATAIDQTVDGQGTRASQRYTQFKNLAALLQQRLASASPAAAAGEENNFAGISVGGVSASEVLAANCDTTLAQNLPPRLSGGWGCW